MELSHSTRRSSRRRRCTDRSRSGHGRPVGGVASRDRRRPASARRPRVLQRSLSGCATPEIGGIGRGEQHSAEGSRRGSCLRVWQTRTCARAVVAIRAVAAPTHTVDCFGVVSPDEMRMRASTPRIAASGDRPAGAGPDCNRLATRVPDRVRFAGSQPELLPTAQM
jgi:hypothetical protein